MRSNVGMYPSSIDYLFSYQNHSRMHASFLHSSNFHLLLFHIRYIPSFGYDYIVCSSQSASIIEQGRAEQGRVEHSVDSDYPAGRTRSPWENWHVYEPAQVPGGFRDPAPVWIAPDTPWHVYVIIVGLVTFISYVITSRAFTMQCQTCI